MTSSRMLRYQKKHHKRVFLMFYNFVDFLKLDVILIFYFISHPIRFWHDDCGMNVAFKLLFLRFRKLPRNMDDLTIDPWQVIYKIILKNFNTFLLNISKNWKILVDLFFYFCSFLSNIFVAYETHCTMIS